LFDVRRRGKRCRALKQADVGVALLTGFGDLNVDRGDEVDKNKLVETKNEIQVMPKLSEEHLAAVRLLPVMLLKAKIRQLGTDPDKYPELSEKEDLVKLYDIKAREAVLKRNEQQNAVVKAKMTKAELQAKARSDAAEKQRKLLARVAELEAQGEQWATFKAMKEFYSQEAENVKAKQRQFGTVEGSAAAMAAQFEDVEVWGTSNGQAG
jgi:cation-transporting ATPase 13A1